MDKIKILCVDDEEGVLKIYRDLFHNHDLITESSSLKASELIKKKKYDIIIVDYQMPGINGIELLEEIKEEYKNWSYVSIFATAYGTIHLFKAELIKGIFNYFIEKPFEIDNLKNIMKKSIITLGRIRNKNEN